MENIIALVVVSICITLSLGLITKIQSGKKTKDFYKWINSIKAVSQNTGSSNFNAIDGKKKMIKENQLYKYTWNL